jgi:hypothetical protein
VRTWNRPPMPRSCPPIMSDTASYPKIILLPAGRFFVRTIPLAVGGDVSGQIALALENLAPFPLTQLYYGWVLSARGDSALVFAAYRKRFSAEETAEWNDAVAVLPEFLALLAGQPDTPTVRLLQSEQALAAAIWNGTQDLPAAVVVRELAAPADDPQRTLLVSEIKSRTGLTAATVNEFYGVATATVTGRGGVLFQLGDGSASLSATLDARAMGTADVRDKEYLAARRAGQRRDLLLWRVFVGAAAGLAVMLLLEGGLWGARQWVGTLQAKLESQAPQVQRIESAQALGTRIEEMTQKQLLPFEMLALINQNRPASVQFTRTVTTGLYSMDIEAQTPQASDVGQYEAILRTAPELERVETRDLRSRDGVTTFILSVNFKAGIVRREGGS